MMAIGIRFKSVGRMASWASWIFCPFFLSVFAGYDNSDTEIYFCGFCTGICVISNVAIAKTFCKDAEVSVIENACACVTPESHKTAIEAMKMIQVNII